MSARGTAKEETSDTTASDNIDNDAMLAEAEAAQAAAEADDVASRAGSVEESTASASAAAAVAATAALMASAKNKRPPRSKDMPRRPLSAYNLFFRDQREDIKARVAAGDMPRDYETDFQAAFLRTRKHKTAEFQAAATTIAARWKALPPNGKSVYEQRGNYELQVYKQRKRKVQEPQEKYESKIAAGLMSPARRGASTTSPASAGAAAAPGISPSGAITHAPIPAPSTAMSLASIRPPMDPRVWGSSVTTTPGSGGGTLFSGHSERSQATTLPYDSGRSGWHSFTSERGVSGQPEQRSGEAQQVRDFASRRSSQGFSGSSAATAAAASFNDEEMLMMLLQQQQRQARMQEAESLGRFGMMTGGASGGDYAGQQHLLQREEMEQELRYARLRRQALDSLLGDQSRMEASDHNNALLDSLLGGATADGRGATGAAGGGGISPGGYGDWEQHQQSRLSAAVRTGFGGTGTIHLPELRDTAQYAGQQQSTGGRGSASSAMLEQRRMELESIRQSVRHAQLEYDQAAARLEYEKARERAHIALVAVEQERLQHARGGGGGGEQYREGRGQY